MNQEPLDAIEIGGYSLRKRARYDKDVVIASAAAGDGSEILSTKLLDDFICRLNSGCGSYEKPNVTEKEILSVICQAQEELKADPMLMMIKPPVKLCGDIHGQFEDLVKLFEIGGCLPKTKYIFLGDYVDRGDKSVEVISLLLAYKARYPNKLYLLRGNHESKHVNKNYSFYSECLEKYSKKLYTAFSKCFNYMPVAAVVGGKIFCVHGGIGPSLRNLNQILKIKRPTEVPPSGLLCDLLWADPSEYTETFGENTDRNCSYIFGAEAITEFLCKNKLELFCRAHEVAMRGYKFFKKQRQLVTLFSAPKYNGYTNKGAIMEVAADMTVTFKTLH